MARQAALRAVVQGLVQGVYFRRFVLEHALKLGLKGFVRNLADRSFVEVQAEGEREKLEELTRLLWLGPQGAEVHRVEVEWSPCQGCFDQFRVMD